MNRKERRCPDCGNKKGRLIDYVELWDGHFGEYPNHYGYRCKLCGHFWEVVIVNTEPL